MVAKASSVSHGYNALNYVCTKKDAMPIKFHNLPEGSDMGKDAEPSIIWYLCKQDIGDRKHIKVGDS